MSRWVVRPLKDLLDIQNGFAFDSKRFSHSSGMPLIRIRDLKNGIDTETKYTGDYDERYVVHTGDLLVGMDGEFGCYRWNGGSALLNQRVCRLRSNGKMLDESFLFYGLNGHLKAIEDVTSYTTVKHISSGQILSIEFPVPPLPEQKRIVKILDEAFAGIDTATANAEKNHQNARAILEKQLESVFAGQKNGWTEKVMSTVCHIPSLLVDPRKKEYADLVHVGAGNITSLTGALIELKTAREEHLISGKFLFDKSMVLYSKIRPYLMKVARPDFNGLCSADMYPLAPVAGVITRDFLFYLLLSKPFTEYAILGSARAGMPKVNREHLFAYKVWLPPIKEQSRLSKNLDSLSEETHRLTALVQNKIAALESLKSSLLHQAFSGKL